MDFIRQDNFDSILTQDDIQGMQALLVTDVEALYNDIDNLRQEEIRLRNQLTIIERQNEIPGRNIESIYEDYNRLLDPDRQFNHDRGFIVYNGDNEIVLKEDNVEGLNTYLRDIKNRTWHVVYVACAHVVIRYIEFFTRELMNVTHSGSVICDGQTIVYNNLSLMGKQQVVDVMIFVAKFRAGVYKELRNVNTNVVQNIVDSMLINCFPNIAVNHQFTAATDNIPNDCNGENYRFYFSKAS